MNEQGEPLAQQLGEEHPPAPPPAPEPEPDRPADSEPDSTERRRFSIDGVEWVAWVSGTGAAGTGSHGLGPIEAVHFAPAANGEPRQHREALIARGRFRNLFEVELLTLFDVATPIDASRPAANNGRRNGRRR